MSVVFQSRETNISECYIFLYFYKKTNSHNHSFLSKNDKCGFSSQEGNSDTGKTDLIAGNMESCITQSKLLTLGVGISAKEQVANQLTINLDHRALGQHLDSHMRYNLKFS